MKKWQLLSMMIVLLLSFTGCGGPQPEEEIFTIYERAAEIEENFAAYGQRIVELEQKEEELYKQIIQDGKKSNQDVQSQIEEVIESITERKGLIEKQLQLIKASYEETAEAESFIEEIKEQAVREKAQRVQELYQERYEAFKELEANYQLTIQLEKQLYADLQEETQDLENLENQISRLNEEYSKNASLQETFSDLSSQLNDAKREFYEAAGIPIE